MQRKKYLFSVLAIIFWASSLSAAEPLKVYSVNYPLQYFAERIGGEHVTVTLPVPPDVDPAYWSPDISAISNYQKADLILLNGAGYAQWVSKVSLPRSKIVDTSRKFRAQYIQTEAATHSHGAEGEHAHENLAFTIWLDFGMAVKQAEAILTAFSRKQPEQHKYFDANYRQLVEDLLALDKSMETLTTDHSPPLIASHPVYQYMARRYGLNLKSLHWEPDEMPSTAQQVELEKMLSEHKAKWMIWEGEPLKETVEMLTSMGIGSLVFDPCANVPEAGNFLSVMQENVKLFQKAFEPQ